MIVTCIVLYINCLWCKLFVWKNCVRSNCFFLSRFDFHLIITNLYIDLKLARIIYNVYLYICFFFFFWLFFLKYSSLHCCPTVLGLQFDLSLNLINCLGATPPQIMLNLITLDKNVNLDINDLFGYDLSIEMSFDISKSEMFYNFYSFPSVLPSWTWGNACPSDRRCWLYWFTCCLSSFEGLIPCNYSGRPFCRISMNLFYNYFAF